MSNLATALALIMAVETPNMNTAAIGDTHLPPGRQAHGRMQGRITLINDFHAWDKGKINWSTADLHNPDMDVLMAQRWLIRQCGTSATVSVYLRTWNGGHSGRNSKQAWAYFAKAKAVSVLRPIHFEKCKQEIKRRSV